MDGVDVYLRHDRRRADAAFRADPRRTGTPIVTPVARRPWREPRFAQMRVMLPCWPTRASSVNHSSSGLSATPSSSAAFMRAGEVALKTAWVTSVNVVEIMV